MLDEVELRIFEAQLREHRVPIDNWVRPGLTDEQIEATLAPLGLRLPAEARVWWRWRNGTIHGGRAKLPGPWARSLSLEDAVGLYRELRGVAEATAHAWPQNDPDFLWHPTWLPIIGTEQPVAIDCSVADGEAVPVVFVDWQNIDGFYKPRAQSLGQLVSWWIAALAGGAWNWNASDECWRTLVERLAPALRTNPLL